MWDNVRAVAYLGKHVRPHSLGRCAEFVRKAIEAGGVVLHRHVSAKDYGPSLNAVGFDRIVSAHADAHYRHQAGDVAVIQPIEGHPHGHMAMFNGMYWLSDFVQYHGVYPAHLYRVIRPPYAVYRYVS